MSELPKLKVRSLLYGEYGDRTEIKDLEQVKGHLDAMADAIVVVEGRIVYSYEDLTRLVTEDFKGKDLIEVTLLPVIEGG